jgi:hypothetical protein
VLHFTGHTLSRFSLEPVLLSSYSLKLTRIAVIKNPQELNIGRKELILRHLEDEQRLSIASHFVGPTGAAAGMVEIHYAYAFAPAVLTSLTRLVGLDNVQVRHFCWTDHPIP